MVMLMSAIETVNHKLSKRKKEVKIKDSNLKDTVIKIFRITNI